MIIQKVLTVGTSLGMTIPSKILPALGIKAGDYLHVSVKDGKMLVAPYRKDTPEVDGDLVAWGKDFITKYRPALEALKDK